MTNPTTRREALGALLRFGTAGACGAGLGGAAARPFCMYSVQDGWSDDNARVTEYITRQATANDPSGVPQVVAQIKRALRFSVAFNILIAKDEDNAFATVANGRKILVVDVDFLDKLNRVSSTRWAAIQVIAHEVGHHIAGFTTDRHRSELNADYWSGQSLQRLGSSVSAASRAILTVGTETDTGSHPSKYRRRDAIRRGWEDASSGVIDYSFCSGCR
jgi:hypothetical protein